MASLVFLWMMKIFVLIGMAIRRYVSVSNPRLNNVRRQEVTKYLILELFQQL